MLYPSKPNMNEAKERLHTPRLIRQIKNRNTSKKINRKMNREVKGGKLGVDKDRQRRLAVLLFYIHRNPTPE